MATVSAYVSPPPANRSASMILQLRGNYVSSQGYRFTNLNYSREICLFCFKNLASVFI